MPENVQDSTLIDPIKTRSGVRKGPRKRGRPELDGRTWQSKMTRETRTALIAHVGGRPSAAQSMLIDTVVNLSLSIATMDAKREAHGALTLHDGREYLAWTNSLRRTLGALGMKGVAERPVPFRDRVATAA